MENFFWRTFGHLPAKSIFSRQIQTGKFSHAYLFKGQDGIGKKTLALEFAQKILQTDRLGNHPDFSLLDRPGEITMEAILEFIPKLSFKPFFAKKKLAIIDNAQNLNLQSSNALLKTLEEPSESSIIILIANSPRLLPTIVSRCQAVNFNAFGKNELSEFARQYHLNFAEEIGEMSFGSIARLKKLSQDSEFFKKEKQAVQEYKNLAKLPLGDRLISINSLAEMETEELNQNLATWLMWQKGQLAGRPEDYGKVRILGESLLGLKRNKNKKLVLQGLLLKI